MIPVRAATVVVRAEVELAPDVLRDVVEERRGEIAHDQNDAERREKHQHVAVTTLTERTLTLSPERPTPANCSAPSKSPSRCERPRVPGFGSSARYFRSLALVALAACASPGAACLRRGIRGRSRRRSPGGTPAPGGARAPRRAARAGLDGAVRDRRPLAGAPRDGRRPLDRARKPLDRPDGRPATRGRTRSPQARRQGLPYGFFCATILQESAFDPGGPFGGGRRRDRAIHARYGRGEGVDPFDWHDPRCAARRAARPYAAPTRDVYPDPYAAALAAYNAGPGAVAPTAGMPPYRGDARVYRATSTTAGRASCATRRAPATREARGPR